MSKVNIVCANYDLTTNRCKLGIETLWGACIEGYNCPKYKAEMPSEIEEMAKIIHDVAEAHHIIWCTELAKVLYNAGYRKQSEGEWLYDWNGKCLEGTDAPLSYKCLVCNEYSTDPFAFCPNCGAKMKGEKQ